MAAKGHAGEKVNEMHTNWEATMIFRLMEMYLSV